jgi:hypothetical protein
LATASGSSGASATYPGLGAIWERALFWYGTCALEKALFGVENDGAGGIRSRDSQLQVKSAPTPNGVSPLRALSEIGAPVCERSC